MAFGKKKKEEDKKLKVVDRSNRANSKPKNATMWCSMHRCYKTSCPKMHD